MGALTSLASVGLNFALAERAAKRQSRSINADRDRQIAEIQARDAETRREEEARLRRQLASQRARAGAAGVGGTGGSSEAVLRGLVQETEAGLAAREGQSALRADGIRRSARDASRRNLLDRIGGATSGGLRTFGRSVGRRSLLG
ncbi:MAG: hypothetical protein R3349_08745 [Geminicoccaceae bacterium]|nr:hypothetical protein [Geminicoccaceae bacterium]